MIGDIWIGISDLATLLCNISSYGFWQDMYTTPRPPFLRRMKETPRRRIAVTSSLKEISTDQLGHRVLLVKGGGGWRYTVLRPPPPLLQQASGRMCKDDVHGFSSTCNICFVDITQSRRQKSKHCNHASSSYNHVQGRIRYVSIIGIWINRPNRWIIDKQ